MKLRFRKSILLTGFCLFSFNTSAEASSFGISFNFSGLTSAQQSYFSAAANFWDAIITGYNDKITDTRISGVSISASGSSIDGIGGVLGSAGPQTAWNSLGSGGYVLTRTGSMQFDTADINNMIGNGTFTSVIEHEMAHVLGFGTLWTDNNLYIADSGKYTGNYGLAAYKSEFSQASAAYVPVELEGSAGTANGHWNEMLNGSGDTGIKDSQGRDMKNELMTGWLNAPTFLSTTTVQSFRDLGYTVVPLPASVWLFGSALLSMMGVSARKRLAAGLC